MTATFTQFNFVEKSIRVFMDKDGNPLFVAKDICEILEIKNHRQAVSLLDDDERGVILNDTPSKNQHGDFGTIKQEMSAVTESGLYALIMNSRKPEAKKFRKWVTNEVLPSIRKTGKYEAPNFVAPEPAQPQTPEMVTRQQLDQIEALIHRIMTCCQAQSSASWACYAFIRESYGVENVHKLPAVHFDRVYGALHVMAEKAESYLKMRCEADKLFIKNVLRQNQIGFEVNQQLLLPA